MSKLFNYGGVIATQKEYFLDHVLDKIEKIEVNSNIGGYKRSLFNSKDHAGQEKYITGLFKKKIYTVWIKGGGGYDVTKKTYDLLMDVYTDKHLFKGLECFSMVNNYSEDYIAAAKKFLR